MFSEQFATGNSFIHRIDPRWKVIYAALFSILVAVAHEYDTLLTALTVSVLLIIAARLSFNDILRRILVIVGFLVLIWLVVPVTYGGETMGQLGPIAVSKQGFALAAKISLKSVAILLSLIALLATHPLTNLGHALQRLGIPHKIVHLLMMTYRYIFVIETEYQRLVRAAKIRGFTPRTSLHTYKTYAYFVGVLFLRAAERAERVSQAMKCRGFQGQFVTLMEFPADVRNPIFSLLMTMGLLLLAAFEWYPLGWP